jgi:hypothetical protein
VEPPKRKLLRTDKGDVTNQNIADAVPDFDKTVFTNKKTKRIYRLYVLKFLRLTLKGR